MFLSAIFLTFFGILHLGDTNPLNPSEISFKRLLDTCTVTENSNSKECQDFISTNPWLDDDIHLVFDKVLEKNSTAGLPALNILKERLIHWIENANFDLMSLGLNSLNTAIELNHESLAIAIWPHLKKYSNDSTDLQLQICSNNMADIMKLKMLPLLTKMVTDRPDCLHQVTDPIRMALNNGCGLEMIIFLNDQGVAITADDIDYLRHWSQEMFAGAVRKYPYSFLLKSISGKVHESLAIEIWDFLKRENCSKVLFQICEGTIILVVNENMIDLVETMHKDFPEFILSKGNILMDIAIRAGMDKSRLMRFLIEQGVKITPGLQLRDPKYKTDSSDYLEMILRLNDIGVEITPKHLEYLVTLENTTWFEWAILNSQLSKETFIGSPVQQQYLVRALQKGHFDHFKKIVDFKVFNIEEIEKLISDNVSVSERERFISYLLSDSIINTSAPAVSTT